MEAIDHDAVTVHQKRPTIFVLLVCLHPDPSPEQKNLTPISAIIKHDVEFSAGSFKERRRLIVLPVWCRQAEANKPVSAIVLQVTDQFLLKVFQILKFRTECSLT